MKSRIGEWIEKRGYKKKHIAEQLGVSQRQMSKWISGESYPTVPKLFRLAELLGVKTDDLYTKDEGQP
ncbi:XRE family transcriptional regulator [Geobacillus sp. MMMUD3]|uniref:helix-turn-helix domain-containing protein n=1 Tax=Geobacillus subterraneus TaxID=129338 RepID=UPI00155E72C9|nr:helix-turn-helix transcriptional regulator [Geobacillus subterraneus]NNV07113.1 XRE family transcriptional regulator [Geobacillus sp. MMMUD3]WPZ17771.1 helix-turn-helix transcriptional regulator [Geobacillus subterraneus]